MSDLFKLADWWQTERGLSDEAIKFAYRVQSLMKDVDGKGSIFYSIDGPLLNSLGISFTEPFPSAFSELFDSKMLQEVHIGLANKSCGTSCSFDLLVMDTNYYRTSIDVVLDLILH